MFKFLKRHKLGLVVVALTLAWLVPNWADMLDDPRDPSQNKCLYGSPSDPIKVARPAYVGKVRTIRLTNAGEFVRRCELTDVLYELNWDHPVHPKEFRPKVRLDAKVLPKFVVLYIHGWKHDASADDTDYQHFTDRIQKLQAANKDSRQVFGVYIGWNAAPKLPPFSFPWIKNLTFWSKERIADRIAQSAVVTKIISAIGAMRETTPLGSDQFVVIGHSFGARILFSAIGQTLIYETEKAHPGYPGGMYEIAGGPANAVVLLNPAFEASIYTALDDVFRNEEHFNPEQLPLLLSISSKGDQATQIAFPIGQWLNFSRTEQERTTLGNYACYQTHLLEPMNDSNCNAPSNLDLSEEFPAAGLCLHRTLRQCGSNVLQKRNPFLIARTPAEVISDHNDIWNDRISGWLFAYIDQLQKLKSVATGG
jgi:pimeloyl-ACP methyl ester carboxylesterase